MTSREPTSGSMRYNQSLGRSGALPPRAPKPTPSASVYNRRIPRVRVEPAKAKLSPAKPRRDPYTTRWSDLTPQEMASFRIYPKGDR